MKVVRVENDASKTWTKKKSKHEKEIKQIKKVRIHNPKNSDKGSSNFLENEWI